MTFSVSLSNSRSYVNLNQVISVSRSVLLVKNRQGSYCVPTSFKSFTSVKSFTPHNNPMGGYVQSYPHFADQENEVQQSFSAQQSWGSHAGILTVAARLSPPCCAVSSLWYWRFSITAMFWNCRECF